jgi:K+-sensing histidine kinase KdpD
MDINDSVRDESYFQHHYLVNNHQINLQYFQKDQPDRQLMLFSRRLNQNNVFQGVAFAIVNNEYIDKFMRSASVAGKQNEIALMLDNNEILFSSSRIKQDIDEVKKMTGQFQNHTHSKEIITFNKFDNDSLRVFAAKQFEYLPISLAIASYENDITTDFFASEESILLFLVSSIIIAAIVLFLALTIKKRLESNQEWLKFGLLANHHKYMLIQEMIGNFKIPLNAIAGFCDILAAEYLGKLSAQQKAHIKDIYQCSTELNNEIEKILYLCDKNHKSFELNNHYTTIGDLFNDTLHYVKQQINTERVQLTFQENMPFVLYIDNVKLAQALANILVKAIYYTPIGNKIQVNYHYDTRNKPLADLNSNIAFIGGFEQIPDQDHNSDANKSASEQEHYADIIIEIINEGMIITEKKLEQEIETFRNLSNDDSIKDFTNSLLLAKVFVELHNGKFEIRNNEDKGTIFSITIPATRVYNDDYHKKIPKPKII